MRPSTKWNSHSKYYKNTIEIYPRSNSRDNLILSQQPFSVTKNYIKFRLIFLSFKLILLVMNLLNSRYAWSNLDLEFLHASWSLLIIHFKKLYTPKSYYNLKIFQRNIWRPWLNACPIEKFVDYLVVYGKLRLLPWYEAIII